MISEGLEEKNSFGTINLIVCKFTISWLSYLQRMLLFWLLVCFVCLPICSLHTHCLLLIAHLCLLLAHLFLLLAHLCFVACSFVFVDGKLGSVTEIQWLNISSKLLTLHQKVAIVKITNWWFQATANQPPPRNFHPKFLTPPSVLLQRCSACCRAASVIPPWNIGFGDATNPELAACGVVLSPWPQN